MVSATDYYLTLFVVAGLVVTGPVILLQRFLIRAQRQMLAEAGKEINERDMALRECAKERDTFRATLEDVRAAHLDELADGVRTLLTFLQTRARDLDHEDNWWKDGPRPDDDQSDN